MKQKLVELKSKSAEPGAPEERRSAEQGARRGEVDRRHGPDERTRPLRRQGAPPGLAAGKAEIAASSLDAQFNQLEDVGELTEVEARLAALKSGAPAPAIEQ
jgi:phage shock protein A